MSLHSYRLILSVFIVCLLCRYSQAQIPRKVDILIKGAYVFDGNLADSVKTDVGITADRISYIGNSKEDKVKSDRVIKAKGLYLAPGFIDPHTHFAEVLSAEETRANLPCLAQGVTTIFANNDGGGTLEIGKKLDEWNQHGIGTNAALFIGHGSVRNKILGSKNVRPDAEQLEEMKEIVSRAMREGAIGLSTGLFYSPGSFASLDEVVALAKVASSHGGVYDTHLRDEGSYGVGLINAVKEALVIGERSGIPVHISHIKALGADVWNKSTEVIKLVEDARQKGLQVTANQYPYLASYTSLSAAVVPRWAEAGGKPAFLERLNDPRTADSIRTGILENIQRRGGARSLVLSIPDNSLLHLKDISEIAKSWKLSHPETVLKILGENDKVSVISYNMTENDLLNFMKQPWVMTGSDGGAPAHPRTNGSFPKKIREFVLEKKLISMAFAIHTSSGLTAKTFNIKDRGFIKEGFFADIILFDPLKVKDHASFEHPELLSTGMRYVFVNGKLAIRKGKFTGVFAGRALHSQR